MTGVVCTVVSCNLSRITLLSICWLFQVGSILIQLFLDNAFLQTPASQSGDDHSELRPAFKHFMKSLQEDGYVLPLFGLWSFHDLSSRIEQAASFRDILEAWSAWLLTLGSRCHHSQFKQFGAIECDPMILQELNKSVRLCQTTHCLQHH